MTQRSPIVVLLLCCTPYALYWLWHTKNEMNQKYNTQIPTMWLILIPFVGALIFSYLYWSKAQKVTGVMWLLGFFVSPIGAFLAQSKFNEMGAGGAMQQRAA